MSIIKLTIGAALVGTLSIGVAIYYPVSSLTRAQAATTAEFQTVILSVKGMTCGGCAVSVKTALRRVNGVGKVKVSHKQGKAQVTYDPSKTNPSALAAAVTKACFETTPEEQNP